MIKNDVRFQVGTCHLFQMMDHFTSPRTYTKSRPNLCRNYLAADPITKDLWPILKSFMRPRFFIISRAFYYGQKTKGSICLLRVIKFLNPRAMIRNFASIIRVKTPRARFNYEYSDRMLYPMGNKGCKVAEPIRTANMWLLMVF